MSQESVRQASALALDCDSGSSSFCKNFSNNGGIELNNDKVSFSAHASNLSVELSNRTASRRST